MFQNLILFFSFLHIIIYLEVESLSLYNLLRGSKDCYFSHILYSSSEFLFLHRSVWTLERIMTRCVFFSISTGNQEPEHRRSQRSSLIKIFPLDLPVTRSKSQHTFLPERNFCPQRNEEPHCDGEEVEHLIYVLDKIVVRSTKFQPIIFFSIFL